MGDGSEAGAEAVASLLVRLDSRGSGVAGGGGIFFEAVEDGLGFFLVVAGDFGDGEAGVDHDVVAGVEGIEEGGADGALGAVGADEGGGVVDGEDFGGDADTHGGSSFLVVVEKVLFVVAKVVRGRGQAGASNGNNADTACEARWVLRR